MTAHPGEQQQVPHGAAPTCPARPGGLALTDTALALFSLPEGALVLDVGCGTGATVEHLVAHYGLRVVGLDPSITQTWRDGPPDSRRAFVQGHGERLPLRDETVTAVLAECSLSLLPDPGRAFAEFHRVLRHGGYLVVHDVYARSPCAPAQAHTTASAPPMRGVMLQSEIFEHVRAQGLEIIEWQDHSAELKQLVAQAIWADGSLARLWCRAFPGMDPNAVSQFMAQSRPSYFLLVAHKAGR